MPRAPGTISIAELLTSGLLSEADVREDGTVNELTRVLAELEHARLLPRRRRVRAVTAAGAPRAATADAPRAATADAPRAATADAPRAAATDAPRRLACCVCLEAERQYAFVPCYHLCVCSACATRVVRCPLCRIQKVELCRIYL